MWDSSLLRQDRGISSSALTTSVTVILSYICGTVPCETINELLILYASKHWVCVRCVTTTVLAFCWLCKPTPHLHNIQQLANGQGSYTCLSTCPPVCVCLYLSVWHCVFVYMRPLPTCSNLSTKTMILFPAQYWLFALWSQILLLCRSYCSW